MGEQIFAFLREALLGRILLFLFFGTFLGFVFALIPFFAASEHAVLEPSRDDTVAEKVWLWCSSALFFGGYVVAFLIVFTDVGR